MIFCVEEDHEREGDEPDSGDAFDSRRSDLLDAEADLLREHAKRVIATGSISIERPAGMVTARFRDLSGGITVGGPASAAWAGYRSDPRRRFRQARGQTWTDGREVPESHQAH
jgi:hypothetical protein